MRSASTSWGPEGSGFRLSSASSRPCSRWSGFRVRVRVRFRVGVKVSSPAAGCAPRRSGCEPTRGAALRPRPRRTPTHTEGPPRRRRRQSRRTRLWSGRAARRHLVRVRGRGRGRSRGRVGVRRHRRRRGPGTQESRGTRQRPGQDGEEMGRRRGGDEEEMGRIVRGCRRRGACPTPPHPQQPCACRPRARLPAPGLARGSKRIAWVC